MKRQRVQRARWQPQRVPNIPGGTFAFISRVMENEHPLGPGTVEELADWPMFLLSGLFAGNDDKKARFLSWCMGLMRHGVVLHTDCSGRLTPEVAFHMFGFTMQRLGADLKPEWLAIWRGSDILPLSQQIMLGAGALGPRHCFPSLQAKLPQKDQDKLAELRPPPDAPVEDRRAAYAKQEAYMRSRHKQAFGRKRTSLQCMRHPGCACPIAFSDPHGLSEGLRPLTVSIVGIPCTPFTPYGNNEGTAHPAIEAVNLSLHDLATSQFDIMFIEESHRFPLSLLRAALPEKYVVIWIIYGPQDIGFPVRRTRFLAACINRDFLVWVGPAGAPAVSEDFMSHFGHAPSLEANAFAGIDVQEKRDDVMIDLGRKRGLFCSVEDLRQAPVTSLLCPSGASHLHKYKEVMAHSNKVGSAGSFVVDLSQNPDQRCRAGAWLPALTKSSMMYDIPKNHFFTNAEIDAVMGFPVDFLPQSKALAATLPVVTQVQAMDRSAYAKLIGNGMHVASMFCWFAYIFSHTVRRHTLQRLILPLSEAQEEVDDGPEDDCSGS